MTQTVRASTVAACNPRITAGIGRSQPGHHEVAQHVDIPHRAIEQMPERTRRGQPGMLDHLQEFFFGTSASNARTISPNVTFDWG